MNNKKSSLIKISGGLGNQLFQYSFGQYLSNIHGLVIHYHVQTVSHSKSFTNRNLEISKFNFKISLLKSDTCYNKNGLLWRVKRKLVQIFPFLSNKLLIQKQPHDFPSKIIDGYYDGYWQCYQFPNSIKEHLQNHLKLNDKQSARLHLIIDNIQNSTSVSIHIRRSDYINIEANAKIFHTCDMEYYDSAINMIKKQFPDAVFYIFTEDKEWAQENFIGKEFVFVQGNAAIEDMLLMAKCKHNIIANSTFSWWSAFLNLNPSKVVIAPKKWYKVNFKIQNFLPQEWIQM